MFSAKCQPVNDPPCRVQGHLVWFNIVEPLSKLAMVDCRECVGANVCAQTSKILMRNRLQGPG